MEPPGPGPVLGPATVPMQRVSHITSIASRSTLNSAVAGVVGARKRWVEKVIPFVSFPAGSGLFMKMPF